MAEIINLRQSRKKKARKDKANIADNNRIKFGRNKFEKKITERQTIKHNQNLDGKKIEPD